MKVPDDKGLANHIVSESCVRNRREAHREALTGVRVGQPWSRERLRVPGADAVAPAEGNMDGGDIASARPTRRGLRHWHVWTLLEREPGDLMLGQGAYCPGPRREGEEP